jgi:hypothetical protein
MKSRYYYQPGDLPALATKEYSNIKSIGNCEETKLSQCEMSAWTTLKVYHIRDDKRTGCSKDKAATCAKG